MVTVPVHFGDVGEKLPNRATNSSHWVTRQATATYTWYCCEQGSERVPLAISFLFLLGYSLS